MIVLIAVAVASSDFGESICVLPINFTRNISESRVSNPLSSFASDSSDNLVVKFQSSSLSIAM